MSKANKLETNLLVILMAFAVILGPVFLVA